MHCLQKKVRGKSRNWEQRGQRNEGWKERNVVSSSNPTQCSYPFLLKTRILTWTSITWSFLIFLLLLPLPLSLLFPLFKVLHIEIHQDAVLDPLSCFICIDKVISSSLWLHYALDQKKIYLLSWPFTAKADLCVHLFFGYLMGSSSTMFNYFVKMPLVVNKDYSSSNGLNNTMILSMWFLMGMDAIGQEQRTEPAFLLSSWVAGNCELD